MQRAPGLSQQPPHNLLRNHPPRIRRARKAIARLLGPSLSPEDGSPAGPAAAAPAAPLEAGCVHYFGYGANLAFATLARRDVRPLARDPAMVADPAVRMRFKHRGGESRVFLFGEGGR